MYPVQEMIEGMKERFIILAKKNRGIEYVFIRLWDEYETYSCSDEEDILEILVFNIIIASMNVKEERHIVERNSMAIEDTIRDYIKYEKNLRIYYDDNDMKLIEDMIDQISACKEKWVK